MTLIKRFYIVAGVVAVGLAIQGLLYAHLYVAPQMESGSLNNTLASFDMKIGEWQGRPLEMDQESQYATDHLKRAYRKGRFELILWMVFSDMGEDRKHNPEVCLSTHGHTEDPSGQALVEVEGHESPVQRYRFTHPQGEQLVYYWHYALPAEDVEGLTSVQRFYQEVRKRRASITLQVFAPNVYPEESVEFVKLADAAVQEFVGPEAVRSCKRRPLTFIEE